MFDKDLGDFEMSDIIDKVLTDNLGAEADGMIEDAEKELVIDEEPVAPVLHQKCPWSIDDILKPDNKNKGKVSQVTPRVVNDTGLFPFFWEMGRLQPGTYVENILMRVGTCKEEPGRGVIGSFKAHMGDFEEDSDYAKSQRELFEATLNMNGELTDVSVCEFCGMLFDCRKRKYQHMKWSHKQLIKCELCSKTYVTNSGLWRHMKVKHTAAKLLSCSLCCKHFVLMEGLRRHINDCHVKFNKHNGLMNGRMGLTGKCTGKMFPPQSKYDFEQGFDNTDMRMGHLSLNQQCTM